MLSRARRLEGQGGTTGLLLSAQLEVLASLEDELLLGLARRALQSKDDLLGGLGLLVEDGLGLTSVTGLLSVISPLSLGHQRVFTLLVLGDLVRLVLLALLALAVGPSGLGNVDPVNPPTTTSSVVSTIWSSYVM